eukprot:TRINITY_DN12080_c0_g1_i1.p1 TRINITY_DN12080_c0_g1~~TRINITY_DN12080_c0_g1_i1.p1  ORF type:complete len:675 (+),score=171.27 TRINITY_DN12080_c0_g1_i1:33-2057(+)
MWYQQPDFTPAPGVPPVIPVPATYSKNDEMVTLFEGSIPVVIQRGKEPSTEVFVVGVMTSGTFPSDHPPNPPPNIAPKATSVQSTSTKRAVHLRITSPSDPFLLYTSTVTEEAYPNFKEQQSGFSLLFDFVKFPSVLVELLEERQVVTNEKGVAVSKGQISPQRGDGTSGEISRSARLSIEEGSEGRFSFTSTTIYRNSEVLGLQVNQEDDSGQKRYLASKATSLQSKYLASSKECDLLRSRLAELSTSSEGQIDTLRCDNDSLQRQIAVVQSELTLQHEQRERELQTRFSDEKSAYENLQRVQLQTTIATHEQQLSTLQHELKSKTDKIETLQETVSTLGVKNSELTKSLEISESERATLRERLAKIEAKEEGSGSLIIDQKRSLESNQLKIVELEEKVKRYSEMLAAEKARNEELYRETQSSRGEIDEWKKQAGASLQTKEERDADLTKAHHVIRTLHGKLQDSKLKRKGLLINASKNEHELSELRETKMDLEDRTRKLQIETESQQKEVVTLKGEIEKLSLQLKEANSCIEYHHRSGQGSYSRPYTSKYSSPVAFRGVSQPSVGLTTPQTENPAAGDAAKVSQLGAAHPHLEHSLATLSHNNYSTIANDSAPAATSSSSVSMLKSFKPSILTSSPTRTPNLVMSLAKSQAPQSIPSNFFVSEVTGPIGTTA